MRCTTSPNMAEVQGTPFEDALPERQPRPAASPPIPGSPLVSGTQSGLARAPGPLPASGPSPGSAEEAEIIFRALAGGSVARTRARAVKPGVVVGTVLILIATVIALILGADYLRHVAGSSGTSGAQGAGSGGAGAGGTSTGDVTESNVELALSSARSYETVHGGSLDGITVAYFAAVDPALSFASVAATPDQVAIAVPVAGAVVLTSFQPSPAACMGVLLVSSTQAVPIFVGYPVTSHRGTYFFEAPASAGLCNALTADPPGGGSYVSTTRFPTEQLP